MAKFTKIPETAFQEIQLNAGVLLKTFEPSSATISPENILGATTGGISFTATPEYMDFGEDLDNCPKNMKEMKKLSSWEILMSGTFVTINPDTVKMMIGPADVAAEKITPRVDVMDSDFQDIWWVGDYSDKNGETNGGFCAIHMMNALSNAGFSLQSGDKTKGQFAFEFAAHFSMADQTKVPFEVYVKAGTDEMEMAYVSTQSAKEE